MSFLDVSCRKRVAIAAQATQDELSSQSRIIRHIPKIHHLSWNDVHSQTLIGIGGFSRVNQVEIKSPGLSGQRLALKSLKRNVMDDEKCFMEAAKDLSAEALILTKVQHRNIVKLHAVSEGGPFKAFTETKQGYFLVLDLLDDTLTNKLEKARNERGRKRSRIRPSKGNSPSEVFDRMKNVAVDLAKGLAHLHQNHVVLRDLKPDNIGFDRDGTVKIFDLGFARELHTIEKEICGSLRYMAPEIMRGELFTTAADVYSFGVVLFELCTLEKPFDGFKSVEKFVDEVMNNDWRPSLASIESVALRRLIEECWNPDPVKRPSMARVAKSISLQIGRYSGLISPVERQFSRRKLTRSQSFSGAINFDQVSEVSKNAQVRASKLNGKPKLHAKFVCAMAHFKTLQRRPFVGRIKLLTANQTSTALVKP